MYANKKALVLGLSKSGISAAKLLNKLGADVYISEVRDKKPEDSYRVIELEDSGIQVEMGKHSDEFLKNVDLCITSPGIPPQTEVFNKLKENGVGIISEIELAYLNTKTPFIAITGTNGKTTTTALTNHIISSEFKSSACGNIGLPPCDLVGKGLDFLVCELSSYQLEMSPTFKPFVALFTNFSPDHLDWHGGLDNYFNAKAKIFAGPQAAEYRVVNAKDNKIKELGNMLFDGFDCYIKDEAIYYQEEKIISLADCPLVGHHNYQNIMAAIICAKLAGVSNEGIKTSIMSFVSPEHRLEKVATINGMAFYNDSKATNPEAAIVAMKSFAKKTVALIAGGTDKKTSLDEFCQVAKDCITAVVLIGEGANRFELELKKSGYNNIIRANSLEDAIDKSLALKLDVCLLSPACASFDMFNSYEHRGGVFKDYVLKKC